DFDKADGNGDGKVTRAELKAFYLRAGFGPVLTVVRPPSLQDVQVAEALFRHLGPDAGGRLTPEKLRRAVGLLAKLDENEDEVLPRAEVLSPGPDASLRAPAGGAVHGAAAEANPTGRVSLVVRHGKAPALRIDPAGKGLQVLPAAAGSPVQRVRFGDAVLAF